MPAARSSWCRAPRMRAASSGSTSTAARESASGTFPSRSTREAEFGTSKAPPTPTGWPCFASPTAREGDAEHPFARDHVPRARRYARPHLITSGRRGGCGTSATRVSGGEAPAGLAAREEALRREIASFQRDQHLPSTGTIDAATPPRAPSGPRILRPGARIAQLETRACADRATLEIIIFHGFSGGTRAATPPFVATQGDLEREHRSHENYWAVPASTP